MPIIESVSALILHRERPSVHRPYEVIIIGAGPAGATLAFQLASRGIKTLVIDRSAFPRYKCCGGGLTVKAAQLLDIDITSLVDDSITGATVTFKGDHTFHGDSPTPIMYTLMREKFDHALVARAREAGAEVLEGAEALSLEETNEHIEVTTKAGTFSGSFVVGADGARSRVAKMIGANNHAASVFCLTCRLLARRDDLAAWRARIGIDIGRVTGGYGWVFPKSDHLSVGIARPTEKAKGLKKVFQEFLDSLNFRHYEVTRWGAEVLPVLTGRPVLVKGRTLLLGDAAGLADPMTGEGIYNALLSARLGAPAIEKALVDGPAALDDYAAAVAGTILPEMKAAFVFSRLLTVIPARLLDLAIQDERVWNACCRLLRGEVGYAAIRQRISSLGGLYKLLSRML